MTKNIIFKKDTTFTCWVTQPFCRNGETITYNGNKDYIVQTLPTNNFSKVSGGPTTINVVWPKNYNNEWLIYDGTALWQLSNGNFSIINSNMNAAFSQTDVLTGVSWEFSSEKNLFYYSDSGYHSNITEEYYTPGKLYTLSGNNYSTFTNYSDYLNNQFPSISGLLYPTITLLNVTAHGPYFLGVFLIEHVAATSDDYNNSIKIVWSTNGTSWNSKTIQGTTTGVFPASNLSDFGIASADNHYLLVDFSGRGVYLGAEFNCLSGTNPSSFSSGSIASSSVISPPLTMTKMGNYYCIGENGFDNSGTTLDFVTFSSGSGVMRKLYNNGFYDPGSIDIEKDNTTYYSEYCSPIKVHYDGGTYDIYGLINNNKIYTFSENNGWSSCNLSNLVAQPS
jgi:hypothetical protein